MGAAYGENDFQAVLAGARGKGRVDVKWKIAGSGTE